jgi:hypothetical protein
MPCSLEGSARFLSLLFLLGSVRGFGSSHGQFQREPLLQNHLEGDRIRVRYFIDLAEIPTYQELQQANISPTAIDPNSTAVINYVALPRRGTGTRSHSRCGWQTGSSSPHLQRSHLSSRRGWPANHEDGICLRSGLPATSSPQDRQHQPFIMPTTTIQDTPDGKRLLLGSAGSLLRSFGSRNGPQRRVEQLSNRSADQSAAGS